MRPWRRRSRGRAARRPLRPDRTETARARRTDRAMHILATTSASLDDRAEPVDLGQAPGDVAVLSFTDSDLAAVAAAWRATAGWGVSDPIPSRGTGADLPPECDANPPPSRGRGGGGAPPPRSRRRTACSWPAASMASRTQAPRPPLPPSLPSPARGEDHPKLTSPLAQPAVIAGPQRPNSPSASRRCAISATRCRWTSGWSGSPPRRGSSSCGCSVASTGGATAPSASWPWRPSGREPAARR